MDNIKNPFTPGAGTPPPALAGRDEILKQADILFGRVHLKKSEKSFLLTGLRGVGKTVLLNEIERKAKKYKYLTSFIEIPEGKNFASILIPELRRLLFEIDRVAGVGDKVRRGLGVLKSFINSITITVDDINFGIDIDPERGIADSGDLEIDLTALFLALGEAAEERKTSIALLLDEIQYLNKNELAALIMAMHKIQQRQLPIVIIGAGLPTLPGLAGNAKSYAERLFNFPIIGPLCENESAHAISDPIIKSGENISIEALNEIFKVTKGYPYFIQEWGYQTWNIADNSPISVDVVHKATAYAIERLDKNFFRVRFNRLTPKEKMYLRTMAELGPNNHKTSSIAQIMRVSLKSLGPLRDSLIKKGMVYSPEYGYMAFTVPLFDEFMRRAMPLQNLTI